MMKFPPILGPNGKPARQYLAGSNYFQGASRTRQSLKNWNPYEESINDALALELRELRARSYDLYRSSPIGFGAIDTQITNIVGPGLQVQSMVDKEALGMGLKEAEAWQSQTEREWDLFANTKEIDATEENNFYELQDIFLRNTFLGGDCFAVFPILPRRESSYKFKIQLIEGSRCNNPNRSMDTPDLMNGIEYDGQGRAVAYHFSNMNLDSFMGSSQIQWARVPKFGATTGRRNVIHGKFPSRVQQGRGIPILSPVIESLKQLSRYSENELMAAVISAMFTAFLKQPESTPWANTEEITADTPDPSKPRDISLGFGAVFGLEPGEDIVQVNPARPNANFEPFWTAILREVGAGTGVPYEILIKHFSASYSASRAAFLMAWKMFMHRRKWLEWNFCNFVYEAFMYEAVILGRIIAPGFLSDPILRRAYLGAIWIGPAKGQIDEYNEMKAMELHQKMKTKTLQKITAEVDGGDWDKNVERAKVEQEKLKEFSSAPEEEAEDDEEGFVIPGQEDMNPRNEEP